MKLLPPVTLALATLLLGACASDPPPLPPSYAERSAARPRPREVSAPPKGLVAPVDRWRERLRQLVPAPWALTGIDAQVEAPPGWTRVAGDRGLVLAFDDGVQRQEFWVLPRGFDGLVYDPANAAEIRACGGDFILYGPRADRPGWNGTTEVAEALELR
jgi:hypothetical protein